MKNHFIPVDEYVPEEEDRLMYSDGKLVVIPFDEIYGREDLPSTFCKFFIMKTAWVRNLNIITQYVNYFEKYYDTDKELIQAYLGLKVMVDNKKRYITQQTFTHNLYTYIFTDSIIEKVKQFVEDNYKHHIDDDPLTNKISEDIRFTDEHTKILYAASMGIKMVIPIVFHYLNKYKFKTNGLYQYFERMIDIFSPEGVNIYYKLWKSVHDKTLSNFKSSKILWNQREVYGETLTTRIMQLFQHHIVVGNLYKYSFEKNPIKLNNVVVDSQLKFISRYKYPHNLVNINEGSNVNSASENDINRIDKLLMNASKIDESILIISDLNIKSVIRNIEEEMGAPVSKDELNFYMNYHKLSPNQLNLVNYFYANYFNGFLDLEMLNKQNYLTLVILLKKRFLYLNCPYLAQLITGNISGKLVSRPIQNQKFISKMETDPIFQTITQENYKTLIEVNGDYNVLTGIVSSFINTSFTIVDYDYPEKTGQPIIINPDAVCEEYNNYLKLI